MSKTCTDSEMHSRYRKMRVNGKEVKVHRYVMEQILGRPLGELEFVHHINENRYDNRPENLRLVTPKEHIAVHDQSYRSRQPVTQAQILARSLNGRRNKGRKHTLETREKVTASLLGNQRCRGRILTPEHKAKIAESMRLARKNNPSWSTRKKHG